MKASKTENRFETSFQQAKTGLPKKPVLTSLIWIFFNPYVWCEIAFSLYFKHVTAFEQPLDRWKDRTHFDWMMVFRSLWRSHVSCSPRYRGALWWPSSKRSSALVKRSRRQSQSSSVSRRQRSPTFSWMLEDDPLKSTWMKSRTLNRFQIWHQLPAHRIQTIWLTIQIAYKVDGTFVLNLKVCISYVPISGLVIGAACKGKL